MLYHFAASTECPCVLVAIIPVVCGSGYNGVPLAQHPNGPVLGAADCAAAQTAHLLWYGLLTWMWIAGSTVHLLPGIVLSSLLVLRGAGAVPFCLE